MNAVIQSVVDMLKTWSHLFEDFHEAKMVVLEWDRERRGIYESDMVWDFIIQSMYDIEMNDLVKPNIKINNLMRVCNRNLMWPLDKITKNTRMVELINSTKDRINYYKNNPEEE